MRNRLPLPMVAALLAVMNDPRAQTYTPPTADADFPEHLRPTRKAHRRVEPADPGVVKPQADNRAFRRQQKRGQS